MITLDQEGGKKVTLMTENEDITKLTQLCDQLQIPIPSPAQSQQQQQQQAGPGSGRAAAAADLGFYAAK